MANHQTRGIPQVSGEQRQELEGWLGWREASQALALRVRAQGLAGVSRRRGPTTTRREPQAEPPPDLVQRQFRATRPDQLWVADITDMPTQQGFVYLALVLDGCSRKLVGWAVSSRQTAALRQARGKGSCTRIRAVSPRPWPPASSVSRPASGGRELLRECAGGELLGAAGMRVAATGTVGGLGRGGSAIVPVRGRLLRSAAASGLG